MIFLVCLLTVFFGWWLCFLSMALLEISVSLLVLLSQKVNNGYSLSPSLAWYLAISIHWLLSFEISPI